MEAEASVLDDYVLSLAPAREPRICLLPTAGGDSEAQIRRFSIAFGDRLCEPSHVSLFRLGHRPVSLRDHLLAQDVIYVGGGSMINLLALWRAHGLDEILREAWHAGIVLAGLSAGSMCWFEHGITNSHGHPTPAAGLGFLPGSNSVHYDGEPERRPAYLEAVASGALRPATASTTASGCCSAARASPRSSPRTPARAPTVSRPPTASPASTSSSRASSRAAPTTSPARCRTTSASCGCCTRRGGRCATARRRLPRRVAPCRVGSRNLAVRREPPYVRARGLRPAARRSRPARRRSRGHADHDRHGPQARRCRPCGGDRPTVACVLGRGVARPSCASAASRAGRSRARPRTRSRSSNSSLSRPFVTGESAATAAEHVAVNATD